MYPKNIFEHFENHEVILYDFHTKLLNDFQNFRKYFLEKLSKYFFDNFVSIFFDEIFKTTSTLQGGYEKQGFIQF